VTTSRTIGSSSTTSTCGTAALMGRPYPCAGVRSGPGPAGFANVPRPVRIRSASVGDPAAVPVRPVRAAIAGVVAAAVALGVGELVSAADDAGTSLVSVVGQELIDLLAGSLKDLAVE